MFVVEASVSLLFIIGFLTWLLLSERLLAWRDAKDERRVSTLVAELQGNRIAEVLSRFGPPREHFQGSSGRSLYIWRRPPSTGLPRVRGLLVLTLTVDTDGRVVESAWQRR